MADVDRAEERHPAAPANVPALGWLFADQAIMIASLSAVKWLDGAYPSIQLVFLRSLIGLIVMAPWLIRTGPAALRTSRPALHLLRVVLSTAALTGGFYAVAHLPLADVMAINHARPLLLTVLAGLILAERIDGRRWLFTLIGLVGLMVMVVPELGSGGDGPLLAYVVAVLAACAGVGAVIVQKILTRRDSEPVLMTYYMIAITLVSGVPALLAWRPVALADWPIILLIGLTALAGQYCFLRAYRLGEASFLAPFGYFRMVLAVAAGWFLFAEWPDAWTLAGAAIIIVAAALLGARWRRTTSG